MLVAGKFSDSSNPLGGESTKRCRSMRVLHMLTPLAEGLGPDLGEESVHGERVQRLILPTSGFNSEVVQVVRHSKGHLPHDIIVASLSASLHCHPRIDDDFDQFS